MKLTPDWTGWSKLVGLTEDVDAADLLLHLSRVELAHVAAAVRLLHLADLQLPDPGRKSKSLEPIPSESKGQDIV